MSNELIERLNRAAKSASEIAEKMSKQKSLRQGHNPPRDDLYSWPKPEDTLEGKAANKIADLTAKNERLRGCLEIIRDGDNSHVSHFVAADALKGE